MSLPRLLTAVSLLTFLAACGDSPEPPAQQAEAAPSPTTTTTTVAETPAPADSTAMAAATPPPPAATPAEAPAPAADAAANDPMAPMVGLWSADLATCGSTPIRITPTSFEGAENQCQIESLTDNGDGSYTAALNCTSAGTESSERIMMRPLFAPTGEGIGLTYLDRGNEEVTILRCAQPQTASSQ